MPELRTVDIDLSITLRLKLEKGESVADAVERWIIANGDGAVIDADIVGSSLEEEETHV